MRGWKRRGQRKQPWSQKSCPLGGSALHSSSRASEDFLSSPWGQLHPVPRSRQPWYLTGTGRQIMRSSVQGQSDSAKREISFFQRTHSALKEQFLSSETTCHSLKQFTSFGGSGHSLKEQGHLCLTGPRCLGASGGPEHRSQAHFLPCLRPRTWETGSQQESRCCISAAQGCWEPRHTFHSLVCSACIY